MAGNGRIGGTIMKMGHVPPRNQYCPTIASRAYAGRGTVHMPPILSQENDAYIELLNLKQGSMTIKEYYQKFQTLLKNCELQECEEVSENRFLHGLNKEIQGILLDETYTSLSQLFRAACRAQRTLARLDFPPVDTKTDFCDIAHYQESVHGKTKPPIVLPPVVLPLVGTNAMEREKETKGKEKHGLLEAVKEHSFVPLSMPNILQEDKNHSTKEIKVVQQLCPLLELESNNFAAPIILVESNKCNAAIKGKYAQADLPPSTIHRNLIHFLEPHTLLPLSQDAYFSYDNRELSKKKESKLLSIHKTNNTLDMMTPVMSPLATNLEQEKNTDAHEAHEKEKFICAEINQMKEEALALTISKHVANMPSLFPTFASLKRPLKKHLIDFPLSQDDQLIATCDKENFYDNHSLITITQLEHQQVNSVLKNMSANLTRVHCIANKQEELKLMFSLNTIGYIEFDIPCNPNFLEEKIKSEYAMPCFDRITFYVIGKYDYKGEYLVHRVYIYSNLKSPFVLQQHEQLEGCTNTNHLLPRSRSFVFIQQDQPQEGEHCWLLPYNPAITMPHTTTKTSICPTHWVKPGTVCGLGREDDKTMSIMADNTHTPMQQYSYFNMNNFDKLVQLSLTSPTSTHTRLVWDSWPRLCVYVRPPLGLLLPSILVHLELLLKLKEFMGVADELVSRTTQIQEGEDDDDITSIDTTTHHLQLHLDKQFTVCTRRD